MQLKRIDFPFSVCKVADYTQAPLDSTYCFIGRTDAENSLVCASQDVPPNVTQREDGWRAFRIEGVLDFSLIGILARISGILAENGIGLFAISTFDTDYILTRQEHFERALLLLGQAGYEIV